VRNPSLEAKDTSHTRFLTVLPFFINPLRASEDETDPSTVASSIPLLYLRRMAKKRSDSFKVAKGVPSEKYKGKFYARFSKSVTEELGGVRLCSVPYACCV